MQSNRSDAALELLRAKNLVRANELVQLGVAGETLQQLLRTGIVVRISRGLYAAPDRKLTEHDQLAQLSIKHPRSQVICKTQMFVGHTGRASASTLRRQYRKPKNKWQPS